MRTGALKPGRLRGETEGGAALVEMAIIMPLLLLLIIGILEYGALFKDYLTASSTVRETTRILSALGDEDTADCHALQAATESISTAANVANVVNIQIYRASPSTGDQIPLETNTYEYTGSASDKCTLTAIPLTEFEGWALQGIAGYPPGGGRQVLVGSEPLDIIGVRIIYAHSWLTNFPPFSGTVTIDEASIARLEPEGFAP